MMDAAETDAYFASVFEAALPYESWLGRVPPPQQQQGAPSSWQAAAAPSAPPFPASGSKTNKNSSSTSAPAAQTAAAAAPHSSMRARPSERPLLAKLVSRGGGGGGLAGSDGEECSERWPWLARDRRDAQGRRAGEPGYDPSTLHIPAAALASMTDFVRQFWQLKSRAMDVVLFVRHGSFYNLFDIDADVGLRVGLNLSGRAAPNMYKVGCNRDVFGVWAAKVVALGYSVGRVEEVASSGAGGGGGGGRKRLLERRLVQIYTPGTAVDGLIADPLCADARPFLALVEVAPPPQQQQQQQPSPARSSEPPRLGCAVVDVGTGSASFGVIEGSGLAAHSALSTALCHHNPSEVVAVMHNLSPATLATLRQAGCRAPELHSSSSGGNTVLTMLAPSFGPSSPVAANAALGRALPQALQASVASAVRALPSHAARGLALQALLLAVQQLQRCGLAADLLPALQVSPLGGGGADDGSGGGSGGGGGPSAAAAGRCRTHMLLNERALTTLHVLQGDDGDARGSLLAALDGTASAAGKRELRAWLCRPLAVSSLIEERLAVVDLFRCNPTLGAGLQSALKRLPDVQRVLLRAMRALAAQGQGDVGADGSSSSGGGGGGNDDEQLPDGAWAVDVSAAAWRAVAQLPGALGALVEAVAQLRRGMAQLGISSSKLPLVHRAVIDAAKASAPVTELSALLAGARWEPRPQGGAARLSLAEGADSAHDGAAAELKAADQQLAAGIAHVLTILGGGGGGGDGNSPRAGSMPPPPPKRARKTVRFSHNTANNSSSSPGLAPARGQGPAAAAAAAATGTARIHDVDAGIVAVPASLGPAHLAGDFVFAGHSDSATVLVRSPTLAQLAAARAAAAAAAARAADAALARAAAVLQAAHGTLAAMARAVAELDVLAGFAKVTMGAPGSFCRPVFVAASSASVAPAACNDPAAAKARTPALHFDGLVHPVLALSTSGGGGAAVQPNDLRLGGGAPGALLLTGANTSGKSTLLRAACLAAICAQVGCYAPAARAELVPADAIFTRLGARDDLALGLSTFAVEMGEAAAALAAATPSSLVVMDELGRGTSTYDGTAIAHAALVALAGGGGGPRAIFATHYARLARDAAEAGCVLQEAYLETQLVAAPAGAGAAAGAQVALVSTYRLRPGAAPLGSCGVDVAAAAGLPDGVVARAREVAAALAAVNGGGGGAVVQAAGAAGCSLVDDDDSATQDDDDW